MEKENHISKWIGGKWNLALDLYLKVFINIKNVLQIVSMQCLKNQHPDGLLFGEIMMWQTLHQKLYI